MKFYAILASTILTSSVFASSLFGGSGVSAFDDALKVPGDNPLQHCDDPKDDILELESVDLDPNPPSPGQNLTIVAKGTFSEDIEDGAKVDLQVKYGLITIIRTTADLCNTLKNVDKECPIKKGETTFTKDVALPKEIPKGKYTVSADVYTKDKDKITCLKATVEFKKDAAMIKQGL